MCEVRAVPLLDLLEHTASLPVQYSTNYIILRDVPLQSCSRFWYIPLGTEPLLDSLRSTPTIVRFSTDLQVIATHRIIVSVQIPKQ